MTSTPFQKIPTPEAAISASHWNQNPCGSDSSKQDLFTKSFFEEVGAHRYQLQPYLLDRLSKMLLSGKDILEIGPGLGTDHQTLARCGGNLFAMDITVAHLQATQKRFDIFGLKTRTLRANAVSIPFANDSFDFVYSFGVIHHIRSIKSAVAEIHRILKPGGRCFIGIYHRHSIFFWWNTFFVSWILRGGFMKETLKQRLSRIEYPNDDPNLVVNVYSRAEAREIFRNFSEVDIAVDHISLYFIRRFLPLKTLSPIAKLWGWYLLIEATK